MAVNKEGDGRYRTSDGTLYNDEREAHEAEFGGPGGGPGGSSGATGAGTAAGSGGVGGILGGILSILILPGLLVRLFVDWVWGLLSALGIFGKIVQSLLMAVLAPLIVIISLAPAMESIKGMGILPDIGSMYVNIGIFALVIITPVWYFFWHYDVVEAMGIERFGWKLFWFTGFFWISYCIGNFYFGMMKGDDVTGAWVSLVGAVAAFPYYFLSTLKYRKYAVRGRAFKARWIVLAIAVAFTAVGSYYGEVTKDIRKKAESSAKTSAKAAEIKADMPKFVWVNMTDESYPLGVIYEKKSFNSKAIVGLTNGYRLVPTDVAATRDATWYAVEFEGVKGWIDADDVTDKKPARPGVIRFTHVKRNTKLKDGLDKYSKVKTIANIKEGETVILDPNKKPDTSGYYVEVRVWYQGKYGWVYQDALSEIETLESE
jgi:hypothetical protein